jgi:hypothetical protein
MGMVKKLGGTIDVVGEQAQLGMEAQSTPRSVWSVLVPALLVGNLASRSMNQKRVCTISSPVGRKR